MRCPDLAGMFPAWTGQPWHEVITDRPVDVVRTARWQDSTAVRPGATGVPYYVIGKGTDQVPAWDRKVWQRKKPAIFQWYPFILDLFPAVDMPIPQVSKIEMTVMDDQVFVVDPARSSYWEASAFGTSFARPFAADYASRWDTTQPWTAQWRIGIIASRLPLLPMLPTFAEFERGEIPHAWQMAIDGCTARDFVPPAWSTDGQYTPGKLRAGDRLRPTPEGRKRLMDSAQTPHDITAIESWDRHGLVGADRTGNGHLLRVARDERIKLTLQPTAKDFEVLAA